VIVLPLLDRVRQRAAAEVPVADAAVEWVSEQQDLRCLVRELSRDEVELIVQASGPAFPAEAIRVRAATAGRNVDYYVLLTPDESGSRAGDLIIPGVDASLGAALLGFRSSADLTGDDASAIKRSVRATGRSGRNAWRAVARSRAPGDPVRQAIEDEL
jgi:hypothetical protein